MQLILDRFLEKRTTAQHEKTREIAVSLSLEHGGRQYEYYQAYDESQQSEIMKYQTIQVLHKYWIVHSCRLLVGHLHASELPQTDLTEPTTTIPEGNYPDSVRAALAAIRQYQTICQQLSWGCESNAVLITEASIYRALAIHFIQSGRFNYAKFYLDLAKTTLEGFNVETHRQEIQAKTKYLEQLKQLATEQTTIQQTIERLTQSVNVVSNQFHEEDASVTEQTREITGYYQYLIPTQVEIDAYNHDISHEKATGSYEYFYTLENLSSLLTDEMKTAHHKVILFYVYRCLILLPMAGDFKLQLIDHCMDFLTANQVQAADNFTYRYYHEQFAELKKAVETRLSETTVEEIKEPDYDALIAEFEKTPTASVRQEEQTHKGKKDKRKKKKQRQSKKAQLPVSQPEKSDEESEALPSAKTDTPPIPEYRTIYLQAIKSLQALTKRTVDPDIKPEETTEFVAQNRFLEFNVGDQASASGYQATRADRPTNIKAIVAQLESALQQYAAYVKQSDAEDHRDHAAILLGKANALIQQALQIHGERLTDPTNRKSSRKAKETWEETKKLHEHITRFEQQYPLLNQANELLKQAMPILTRITTSFRANQGDAIHLIAIQSMEYCRRIIEERRKSYENTRHRIVKMQQEAEQRKQQAHSTPFLSAGTDEALRKTNLLTDSDKTLNRLTQRVALDTKTLILLPSSLLKSITEKERPTADAESASSGQTAIAGTSDSGLFNTAQAIPIAATGPTLTCILSPPLETINHENYCTLTINTTQQSFKVKLSTPDLIDQLESQEAIPCHLVLPSEVRDHIVTVKCLEWEREKYKNITIPSEVFEKYGEYDAANYQRALYINLQEGKEKRLIAVMPESAPALTM